MRCHFVSIRGEMSCEISKNDWKDNRDKDIITDLHGITLKHWFGILSSISTFEIHLSLRFSSWWCNQSDRYAFNIANINRFRFASNISIKTSNERKRKISIQKSYKNHNFLPFYDWIFIGRTVSTSTLFNYAALERIHRFQSDIISRC